MAHSRPSFGAPARSTRWPLCVRALTLVALGRKSATSVRSRASDGASTRYGNSNRANSDDEHTKDWTSSRLYTCAQRTCHLQVWGVLMPRTTIRVYSKFC
ncbi:hypothetical protein PIB30_085232 [Stylosanthes scabra]|uniref:Secreted protein n=1 Tax=Stylosanthes scabra TaxID=79078 RepID=A0ABU6ZRF8_9FABA|nr:hypothetical protein [Stylosanthes scabra]